MKTWKVSILLAALWTLAISSWWLLAYAERGYEYHWQCWFDVPGIITSLWLTVIALCVTLQKL